VFTKDDGLSRNPLALSLHEKAEADFLETVCLRSALLLLFATLEESAEEEEAITLNAILRSISFVLYYMCLSCVIMKKKRERGSEREREREEKRDTQRA
jgi:hypothetical protein